MFKKPMLYAVVAVSIALLPALQLGLGTHTARAASITCANGFASVSDQTVGGLDFPTGCNGLGGSAGTQRTTACTGPLVAVYGSSALKTYIIQAAQDYCLAQLNGTRGQTQVPASNAIDVEYLNGGDSCPGVQYAANNLDQRVLGVTDVFAPACVGKVTPLNVGNIAANNDNILGVNPVEQIAYCPGAQVVQGGSYLSGFGSAQQCTGTSTTGTESNSTSNPTTCAPADISLERATSLWTAGTTNYASLGGCNVTASIYQRVTGSGTRITFCSNILGPGNDGQCSSNGTPLTATTSNELNAVCPTSGSPASAHPIGYSTRSAVVQDPRVSAPTPLANCALVRLGGNNAYNGTCNPTSPSGATDVNTAGATPFTECDGDFQVITNRFATWGYVHADTNSASQSGQAASFLSFAQSQEDNPPAGTPALVQTVGFMRPCQMNFSRSYDGGPVSGQTPTC